MDTDTRRSLAIATLIIGGLFGLGWSASIGLNALRINLGQRAEAEGVVRGCHMELGRGSHGSRVEVQYAALGEGTPRTLSTHTNASCERAEGAHFRVVYLASDADVAMTAQDLESAPERALSLAVVSALFLVMGLVIWRIRSRAGANPDDTIRDMPSA